jgi:diguanylate cyclase (GGDEF)-like protein
MLGASSGGRGDVRARADQRKVAAVSRAWFRTAWSRLRTDNDLAIITSYAACAVFGIAPFAIYRYATGNMLAGTLDLLIVGFICLPVVNVWRGGNRQRASTVLAIINTVGCLASATVLGPPGLFWMYPALLGNFLLLPRWPAVGITAVAFTFLTVQGKAYDSSAQLAMFLVSATVSGLVAFVFSSRTESQRHELETLAKLDALTGVQNRRAMESELQRAVEEQHQGKGRYGLAMLDLDHFKRINDEHGHEAGDEVLVAFAELLRHSTRKADRCFRFGGEEFVMLMPVSSTDFLYSIDASLRRRVADELVCHGAPVTVSIGAAALRQGEDWQAWLARADAALYQAKKDGRNRTVVDAI